MSSELSARDLRTVLDIVREVSTTTSLTDFRTIVPQLVLGAVPGNMAGYNEIDVDSGQAFVTWAPDDAATSADVERFATYVLDHPSLQHIQRTGDGSAVAISDLVSREQYRQSTLYRELFADLGAEDQIVIGLPAPQPLAIGIPVNRDSWGFGRRDYAVLDELRPHLAQSHATIAVRDLLSAQVVTRDTALDLTGHGVIRLHAGVLVDASPRARHWLDHGLLDGGRLNDDVLRWYAAQLRRLDGEHPELARPFRTAGSDTQAAIRLIDSETLLVEEHPMRPRVDDLRRLGLTAAEAAVLQGIVEGQSTAALASSLHVTAGTVRKHLQSIYRKLGVHSRSAAVVLAFNARATPYRLV